MFTKYNASLWRNKNPKKGQNSEYIYIENRFLSIQNVPGFEYRIGSGIPKFEYLFIKYVSEIGENIVKNGIYLILK